MRIEKPTRANVGRAQRIYEAVRDTYECGREIHRDFVSGETWQHIACHFEKTVPVVKMMYRAWLSLHPLSAQQAERATRQAKAAKRRWGADAAALNFRRPTGTSSGTKPKVAPRQGPEVIENK
jgi:hypothetical protein